MRKNTTQKAMNAISKQVTTRPFKESYLLLYFVMETLVSTKEEEANKFLTEIDTGQSTAYLTEMVKLLDRLTA